MRLFAKPHTVILVIIVILLAGLVTIGVQYVSGDLLQTLLGKPTPPSRDEASTAAIVVEREKLRVGVRADTPPFGFTDANNTPIGFDIDLAHEVARRWLGDAEAIEFVTVSAADRIPRLAVGDVDLLFAAMPYKRERDAFIDFSQPYFVDGQVLLVREATGINDWASLDNQVVAVIQGAPTSEPLQQVATTLGINIETKLFEAYPQAITALNAGEIDAITGDSITLNQFTRNGDGLRIVGERLNPDYYAVGLPQADSSLRALINFTLQDMKADGTYDRFYQRWFPADKPITIAVSPGQWSYQSLAMLPKEPIVAGQSHVETILNRQQLIAAVHEDFWPFSSIDTDGQRVGFDIDIVHEFARRWLGDANAVTFTTGEPTDEVDRVVEGSVDLVIAALVEQREWAEKIDFSQTYLGPPVVSLPLTIGLPRNDSLYRELVNVTLQEMKADGSYDAIYKEWFGADAEEFPIAIIPGDAGYLLSSLNSLVTLPRIRAVGDSTIERIRKRGNLLQVGVSADQAPFTYRGSDGAITGFDADLWRAVAELWQVSVEFVVVEAGERLPTLRSGEVDLLAAGLQRTKEQEADLNFSQTYYVGGAGLLTKPETNIQSINDLNSRAIALLESSMLGDQLQAVADANGIAISLATYPTYDAALAELRQGNVAALLADSSSLAQFTNNSNEWSVLSNLLDATPYSFGLPAEDSYFNNLVNASLQQLKQQGTYDTLYQKWFGTETAPYDLEIFLGSWPYTFANSPATLDAAGRSKVEEIQQRGRLVAGVPFDLYPFGLVAPNAGEGTAPVGFDVEIIQELAKRWLGDPQAIDFVAVTSTDAPQKLASGAVDLVAAALPHLLDSEELIDFSQTYYRGQPALLARIDTPISSIAALNNKTLAAIQGSPAVAQLQAVANRESIGLNIQPFPEFSAAYEALKNQQVDGLVGLQAVLEQISASESGLVVLAGLFPSQAYAIGIPNHDERFQDLVDFTLQEMKQDGTYDRISRKWLPNNEPTEIELWLGNSYLDLDMIPMVRVAAGEFTRGNLYGFPDERIEKRIFLDEFYIDQYEVTNRQYAACVRAGRCNLPRLPRSVNFANYYAATEFGNHPVIWVSWQDGADYCAYRGKRLPTEAEWEKAARGPENTLYPWGKAEPTAESNFNYIIGDASAVGSFPQDHNGYGVYDMGGNVREWVYDWYQWDYYQTASQNNPIGPDEGVTKVLRGGSWNDVAIYVRTTSRKNFLPDSYDSNLGFRCATSTFPPSKD